MSTAQLDTATQPSHSSIHQDTLFTDHSIALNNFLQKYQTTVEYGLSADQVIELQKSHGLNRLEGPPKPSLVILYFKELFSGFGAVLWIAAVLCFLGWKPFGGPSPDIYNLVMCILLLIVIFIQGTFTFIQQVNTSSLLESFQNMLPPVARVKRDGQWESVHAEQLVPGDVVLVQAGSKVPADLRVVECGKGARSEKSSITGESDSIPVSVDCTSESMVESKNLLFCGSSLVEGTATGVVYRTGSGTLLGGIAEMTMQNQSDESGSLQREINYFVFIVATMAIVTSTIILIVWAFLIRPAHPDFLTVPRVIIVCIISSVAFIPDGLPIAVTMTLTLVARSMYKNKCLAKRLGVVETLGSATIIATDKTGTITQNKMSVVNVWVSNGMAWAFAQNNQNCEFIETARSNTSTENLPNNNLPDFAPNTERTSDDCSNRHLQQSTLQNAGNSPSASKKDNLNHDTLNVRNSVALLAALCNKSSVNPESGSLTGSPTECALLRMAINECNRLCNDSIADWQKHFPLVEEISFSSRTKFHATLHKICTSLPETLNKAAPNQAHSFLAIVKGAPEVVLSKCSTSLDLSVITEELRASYTKTANNRAEKGERVLAFAYRLLSTVDNWNEICESQLTFVGFVSLLDPPREGVRESVIKCHEAGIKVIMVTGDHPGTALAIARMVEIVGQKSSPKSFDDAARELETFNVYFPASFNSNYAPYALSHAALSNNPLINASASRGKSTLNLHNNTSNTSIQSLPAKDTTWWSRFFPPMSAPDCTCFPHLVSESILLLGNQLDKLSTIQWDYILSHGEIVFARTTPQHKLLVVQHLQRRGEVVAVTGDGVNDAPALKSADIGIAMGVGGSEVSREAANMILLDDNFSTIVAGIREGRLLFDNLKKVIAYLLSAGSFSEILPVICHAFFGLPLPLSPIQMILICVGTDMLGAVSLAYESPESDIMRKRPRNAQQDRLVSFRVIFYSFFQVGLLEFLIALLVYFITMSYKDVVVFDLLFAYEKWDIEDRPFAGLSYAKRLEALSCAQTGFFLSLVILQMWNLLCVRTRYQSLFGQRMRPSILLVMGLQLLLAFAICWVPWFNNNLRIGHPLWFQWAFPMAMGMFVWWYDEGRKFLIRRYPGSLIRRLAW